MSLGCRRPESVLLLRVPLPPLSLGPILVLLRRVPHPQTYMRRRRPTTPHTTITTITSESFISLLVNVSSKTDSERLHGRFECFANDLERLCSGEIRRKKHMARIIHRRKDDPACCEHHQPFACGLQGTQRPTRRLAIEKHSYSIKMLPCSSRFCLPNRLLFHIQRWTCSFQAVAVGSLEDAEATTDVGNLRASSIEVTARLCLSRLKANRLAKRRSDYHLKMPWGF